MMNSIVDDSSCEQPINEERYCDLELVRPTSPSRRLDDRIRELCARVVKANEDNLEPAISELQAALREHNQQLRRLAAAKLMSHLYSRNGRPHDPERKRPHLPFSGAKRSLL